MGMKKRGVKRGRPTKCTPQLTEQVCELLAKGNFISTACALVGIDDSTYRTWIAKGELDPTSPYAAFRAATQKARAQAEADAVARIQRAGARPEQWTANAWFLERSFPDRWGRKDTFRAEISGPGGAPIRIEEAVAIAARAFELPPETVEGQVDSDPSPTPELEPPT